MYYQYQTIINKLRELQPIAKTPQDEGMMETVIDCLEDEYRMHWIDDVLNYDWMEVMKANYGIDFNTEPYLTPDIKGDWSPGKNQV